MFTRNAMISCRSILVASLLLQPVAECFERVDAAQDSEKVQKEGRKQEQKEEAAGSASPASTTARDQLDLSVTVYNSNLALVRDVRQIHLPSGAFPLRFEDVAASINPTTVHFRSLAEPAKLSVIEQNYE